VGARKDVFHLDHGFALEVEYRKGVAVQMVLIGSALTENLEEARKWADLPNAPPRRTDGQTTTRQSKAAGRFRVNGQNCNVVLHDHSLTLSMVDREAARASGAPERAQRASSDEP